MGGGHGVARSGRGPDPPMTHDLAAPARTVDRAPGWRRWPLALVPVLLGLAYVGVDALLARSPSLEAMVPDDAILVWRYRDLDAFDAAHAPPEGSNQVRASEELGAQVNLPGLPGIAEHRPLLEVTLDPTRRVDARFFVLPVADAGAVRKAFADPDLVERHARHVVVHGAWAAAAWDHRAALDAGRGRGGLPPLPEGARWSVTADWRRLVDAAVLPWVAERAPYAGVLAALGFRPQSLTTGPDGGADGTGGGTGGGTVAKVEAGRVPFVREAWTRVTLVAWEDRVEATLVPAPESELVPLLRAHAADTTPLADTPEPPADAAAWIRCPDARSRKILALALWYAGVAWPEAVLKDGFAALRLDANGAGEAWTLAAVPSPGLLPAWTLTWAGRGASAPAFAAFGLPVPEVGTTSPLARGLAALRAPFGGEPAAADVARFPAAAGDVEVLVAGGGAEPLARRYAAEVRSTAMVGARAAGAPRPIVTGYLKAFDAQRLLGSAVAPGGLLASVAGGDLEVTLTTADGALVLSLRRTPVR